MYNKQYGYQAYLVRLWLGREDGKHVWRASLEDAHTGEKHAFASFSRLVAYLEAHTEMVKCEIELTQQINEISDSEIGCVGYRKDTISCS